MKHDGNNRNPPAPKVLRCKSLSASWKDRSLRLVSSYIALAGRGAIIVLGGGAFLALECCVFAHLFLGGCIGSFSADSVRCAWGIHISECLEIQTISWSLNLIVEHVYNCL